MIRTLPFVVMMLTASSTTLSAQHAPHGSNDARVPTQAGQDAFAAISEIVGLLESDASTNWRTVDLEALRQHLVDMNTVVLQSSPRARNVEGGALFSISAPAAARPAVARMVAMHSLELATGSHHQAHHLAIARGAAGGHSTGHH